MGNQRIAALILHFALCTLHSKGSGGGSCAHGGRAYEARLNLILPAVKWPAEPKLDRAKVGGVDGYRPHMSLLAGQVHYLSAMTPI